VLSRVRWQCVFRVCHRLLPLMRCGVVRRHTTASVAALM
jgi:hypothetical protein